MPKSPVWSHEKYLYAFHITSQAYHRQKYNSTDLLYIMHVSFVCMETIAALEIGNYPKFIK